MKAARVARMLRAAPLGGLSGVRVQMSEADHERARGLVAGVQAFAWHRGWSTIVVSYVPDRRVLWIFARTLATDLRRLRRAGLDVTDVRPWCGAGVVERLSWLKPAT